MCRLILTIAAVVAIAQLSLQASVTDDQHLKYTFRNLGPDDTQMPDIVEISESDLATRNVPVTPLNIANLAFTNWNNYVTSLINVTITNFIDSEICLLNPSFCCRFEITFPMLVTNINSIRYFYRFGIFQGLSGNANIPPPTVCSVFRCATENLLDCDRILATANINTDIVFTRISITANITRQSQYLLEPTFFNAFLQPLTMGTQWHEFEENDYYGMRYVLLLPQTNIYSFSINGTGTGIVGGDDDGAAAIAVSMFIMLGIFLVNFIA